MMTNMCVSGFNMVGANLWRQLEGPGILKIIIIIIIIYYYYY